MVTTAYSRQSTSYICGSRCTKPFTVSCSCLKSLWVSENPASTILSMIFCFDSAFCYRLHSALGFWNVGTSLLKSSRFFRAAANLLLPVPGTPSECPSVLLVSWLLPISHSQRVQEVWSLHAFFHWTPQCP